jgi:sigma-B regulation protein RsbU (phosphoserine phosphatase)
MPAMDRVTIPRPHPAERDRRNLIRKIRRLRDDHRALQQRHEALLRELRLAERVQRSLLPTSFPVVPGVRFAAGYQPLHHMAGDFYSAFRLDRDRLGFYVGDVMGHGPASALLSVLAMQSLRTKRIESNSYEVVGPAEVLANLSNMLLEAELPSEPFLTMTYGVLDVGRRSWVYCTGGHPPPVLLHPGCTPVCLEVNGPLLGAVELPFGESSQDLRPGDRLVLYSDGAQSARWGPAGKGLEALCSRLMPGLGVPLDEQIRAAMAEMSFDCESEGDDVTVLVMDLDG